jgi:hypothetical protein
MAGARRHHYVSQFYLRNFLVPGAPPLLYVIDKRRSTDFEASTRDVAQQRDFHRIDIAGIAPNAIEEALSKFEGDAASAVRTILGRRAVGHDDHAQVLFYYMALTLVKTPAMRSKMDELTNQMMTMIGRHDAADPVAFGDKVSRMIEEGVMESDTDVEALRQAVLSDDYAISLARESHLDLEFGAARDILGFFVGRKWLFIEASEGQFVTCDRPVVLTRDEPGLLGLADPAVQILFPLSPTVVILGMVDAVESVVPAKRAAVAEFNAKVSWNAHRQVYARDDQFEYRASDGQIKPGRAINSDPAFVAQQE